MCGKKFILILTFSFLLIFNSNYSSASSIQWPDYRKSLSNLTVSADEDTDIFVELPSSFLQMEQVTLIVTVRSNIRSMAGNVDFTSTKPIIQINNNAWAEFEIVDDQYQAIQTRTIKIKTKYLKVGVNRIKAIYESRYGDPSCYPDTCKYFILKMFFQSPQQSMQEKMEAYNRKDIVNQNNANSNIPLNSNKVVKSKDLSYEIWYNSDKWTPIPVKNNNDSNRTWVIDFKLMNNLGDTYLRAISLTGRPNPTFLESIAKKFAPDAEVVWTGERTINGQKINVVRAKGTKEETLGKTKYVYFAYSCRKGTYDTLFIDTLTLEDRFQKREADLLNLLKGLVIKP